MRKKKAFDPLIHNKKQYWGGEGSVMSDYFSEVLISMEAAAFLNNQAVSPWYTCLSYQI